MTATIKFCLVNGELLSLDDKHLSVRDRAVTLADGLFETILIKNGAPLWWREHLARLLVGIKLLSLPNLDKNQQEKLLLDVKKLYEKNDGDDTKNYTLRLTYSRGVGARALWQSSWQEKNIFTPTWVMTLDHHQPPPVSATAMVVDGIIKQANHPLAGIKRLASYGDHIWARQVAGRAGRDEALLLNQHHHLVSASVGNVFFLRDNRWLTPPLTDGCLAGIARQKILAQGQAVEDSMTCNDIKKITALVMTNSLGITPLSLLDQQSLDLSLARNWIKKIAIDLPTTIK